MMNIRAWGTEVGFLMVPKKDRIKTRRKSATASATKVLKI